MFCTFLNFKNSENWGVLTTTLLPFLVCLDATKAEGTTVLLASCCWISTVS